MTHLSATKPTFTENPTFDSRALSNVFGSFATGVTVATTTTINGSPIGFTANSFTSVSMTPPLILICIADTAMGYRAFKQSRYFCINVLSAQQQDVSGIFASRGADKFNAVDWRPGSTGAPVLADVAAVMECAHHDWVDAGDHGVLIGRVVDIQTSDLDPLCYFRGRYAGLKQPSQLHTVAGGSS